MVKTPCSRSREPRADPWSENPIPHDTAEDPTRGNKDLHGETFKNIHRVVALSVSNYM